MKGLITSNTLIKQAEEKIEQGLKEGVREPYMKIVVAGMKVMLKGGPDGLLAKLKGSQDPISDCVKGALGLVEMLRRSAKGAMPADAMIPATMTLALQGLDFAEKLGLLKVGKAELDQATQLFVETVLPHMGITPQKMQQMTDQVHGVMQDPEKMSQLQRPQPPSQLRPAAPAVPTPPPGA